MSTYKSIDPLIEWLDVVGELNTQTDRGLAIVGAAIVEEQLKAFILSRLPKMSKDIRRMFNHDGALGFFSNQITLAYAIDLISHTIYCDLNLIREIRNKSAHSVHFASKKSEAVELANFAHKTIKDWANSLYAPRELRIVEATTPRLRFAHTCNRLQVLLSEATQDRKVPTPVSYTNQ
jgi:DNA-binding MltR family transcriptional regulator